ncbi:MAG TPA: type II secretion system ATPase GspE [Armatimonadota bacterium]|nr:type II secretion system ATPase GspE [Armatimonadota bacterium]HOM80692.1 type II secretion system ATPase GspE [Armatimonadota bacterium]HPO73841.1 type II secretion system ATPase GspE [Armatimonadota bacterium]HPT96252.1 type II secretion system ATPase GspE [Armatimonadota bacterium]
MVGSRSRRLGELLRERCHLSEEQIQEAVELHRKSGQRIGQALVSLRYVSEKDLAWALGEQAGLPVVNLGEYPLDPDLLGLLPADLALRSQLLPLSRENGTLTVACADPFNLQALDDIRLLVGCRLRPVVAPADEIKRVLEHSYMERLIQDSRDRDAEAASEEMDIADLEKMAGEAVVIRLVNVIFHQAVRDGASDIHIEPFEREVKVRYRIDGVLREISSPPRRLHPAIVSRIKILGDMNIAERRLPQDGRIRLRVAERQIDVRVSTVPTLYGESVVMRILDKETALRGLPELGMDPETLARFRRLIRRPYGIILVTGPTGSGKTTSLYAALQEIYSPEKKLLTIEDPVEYQLPGVNQIQVRPSIGLTFASGLRHIVRQDPDVIMVGEIRDGETAEIAIHAALTGHLVLSTLHTNDAAGAVARMLDMGAEPYLVASSLIGSVAQRLVRLNCPVCKRPDEPDPDAIREVGLTAEDRARATFTRGAKCEECGFTGYRGRAGVFELLTVDDEVRRMITQRTSAVEIKRYALANQGMRTLIADGRDKVVRGLTTIDEVLRVCQRDEL